MPTCSGDTRTMPARIVGPPLLPVDSSRPFARFDLRPSESPTSSLRRWLSGSSPSALAAESNCAGRHPIPDPVKVLLQVPFEILNRLPVQACRPLIALYP